MLRSFKKSRELKAYQKTEDFVRKGMNLLDSRLYKQAMIEFQNAYELDSKSTAGLLQKEFDKANGVSDFEAALSIGLVLIKIKKDDYELANTLGNCARRQHNYKQANNLYRHALKINKGYVPAFYNLAASMGKVEKYDLDVKESLRIFDKINSYILPDYVGNTTIINEFSEEIAERNKQERADRMAELERDIDEKEAAGELHEVGVLKHEFELLKKKGNEATFDQICSYFRDFIKDMGKGLTEENKEEYYETIYNFGLYALTQKDPETSLECFHNLKSLKVHYKYLNMFIAIAKTYTGNTKEAIDIFVEGLGSEQNNRFFNVNLGLMYRKAGNRLLATKYLAIGAALLEKSDGLYHLSDLIRIADEQLESGNLKKALKLYKIIVEETDDPNIWSSIGEIYINQERYEDAINAYRQILRIDPQSKHANIQLKEIHDIYHIRGEAFYRDSKFKASATMYERALRVMRVPETIKNAITVYKLLKNPQKVEELTEELEEIQKRVREEENEKMRLEHIKTGKISLKRKDYKQAIESFELAFRMKLDKDVFVYLATIYKAMNKNEEMQHLLERWNKMVEHNDKMKKFEKTEQREDKKEEE